MRTPPSGGAVLRAQPSRAARPCPSQPGHDLGPLAQAARAGDNTAWTRLIERLDGTLRSVARSYRLPPADVDDAVQTVWLLAYTRIAQLREPRAIASWLVTMTRRECLRLLQGPVREQLTDDPELGMSPRDDEPDARLLEAERRTAFARALTALPDRHRRLMTLLAAEPALDYERISDILGMPQGSIGPTRGRCLARLGRDRQLRALSHGG